MSRHVLLMLSTDQPPHPVEEIQWHAEECARKGSTVVATTRLLGQLRRDESIIAFYGSADLDNRLLGQGTFAGFARLDTDRGRHLLASSTLYVGANMPTGTQGVIVLKEFRPAEGNTQIDALGGTIEGSGLPLKLDNLPAGPARICVYFRR